MNNNREMLLQEIERQNLVGAVAAAGPTQPVSPPGMASQAPVAAAPTIEGQLTPEEIAIINDPIFFDTDEWAVMYEQKSKVTRKAAILLRNPDIKMLLVGSASELGDKQYNIELAYKRALEVSTLLTRVNQVPYEQVEVMTVGALKANLGNLERDRAVRTYIQ